MAFYVGTCGVAREGGVSSHYPMAGDDYGDWVMGYCVADGLGRHGGEVVFGGDCFGEGAVGCRLAVWNVAEMMPDLLAEGGSLWGKGEVFVWGLLVGEVEVQPVCSGG